MWQMRHLQTSPGSSPTLSQTSHHPFLRAGQTASFPARPAIFLNLCVEFFEMLLLREARCTKVSQSAQARMLLLVLLCGRDVQSPSHAVLFCETNTPTSRNYPPCGWCQTFLFRWGDLNPGEPAHS